MEGRAYSTTLINLTDEFKPPLMDAYNIDVYQKKVRCSNFCTNEEAGQDTAKDYSTSLD
jgi:hypothetical protein